MFNLKVCRLLLTFDPACATSDLALQNLFLSLLVSLRRVDIVMSNWVENVRRIALTRNSFKIFNGDKYNKRGAVAPSLPREPLWALKNQHYITYQSSGKQVQATGLFLTRHIDGRNGKFRMQIWRFYTPNIWLWGAVKTNKLVKKC